MPSGDRTGPMGFGPMTGRGYGRCSGYAGVGFARGGWGRGRGAGRGRGMGRGRGWGQGFGASGWGVDEPGFQRSFPSRAESRSDLAAYRDQLKKELVGVEEALSSEESPPK